MTKKSKIILITIMAFAVISNTFSSDEPFKSKMDQAFYAAMRAGFLIGQAGGTEQDLKKVFTEFTNGDNTAIQLWLNEASKSCPVLVKKSIELGWLAKSTGKSVDETVDLLMSKLKTNNPAADHPTNQYPLADMISKRDGTNYIGVYLGMIAEWDGDTSVYNPITKEMQIGKRPMGVMMFSATSGELLKWISAEDFTNIFVLKNRPEYK